MYSDVYCIAIVYSAGSIVHNACNMYRRLYSDIQRIHRLFYTSQYPTVYTGWWCSPMKEVSQLVPTRPRHVRDERASIPRTMDPMKMPQQSSSIRSSAQTEPEQPLYSNLYNCICCISPYTCDTHCTMLPAEYTIPIQYTSLYIAIHIQHYTAYTLYIAIHSPSGRRLASVSGR